MMSLWRLRRKRLSDEHKKARAMRAYMSLEEGYFENFTSVAKACLAAW